jgi:uncharacterized protein
MPIQLPNQRPSIPAPIALKPLLAKLQSEISPLQIWLFGSRARGDHRPDSDWDIYAVVPDSAAEELLEPWRFCKLAEDSGVYATLLGGRKSEIEGIWGIVNTMGDVLAREGVRIEPAS